MKSRRKEGINKTFKYTCQNMSKRRDFIKKSIGVLTAGTLVACNNNVLNSNKATSDKALAINMWDYTWLLRTHNGGGFEDWEKALDELMSRGYNALRIDCFPQFVAKNDIGITNEVYNIPRNKSRALWGNKEAVSINPKEALLKFLELCEHRQIKIVLSSWFASHGTSRNLEFKGKEGLIRAWNETLIFLEENDALKNIYYVDILNEYPLWHGYNWLKQELKNLENPYKAQNKRWDFLNLSGEKHFSDRQISYYNDFIKSVVGALKKAWPSLLFTASQTNTLNVPWNELDISSFDVLDIHLWFIYNKKFSAYTGYFDNIHTLGKQKLVESSLSKIQEYWKINKLELSDWLDEQVRLRAEHSKKFNLPFGNTEGWGAVMWEENRSFKWDFIKEAGIIGAKIGKKYGYSFNCSSNFNHPHFKSLWDDISWHKEVTSIIKS